MDINYMILAHKNPHQLGRLIKRLKCEHAYFYIHIDKNTGIGPFKKEVSECEQVQFIPEENRYCTPWGDIGAIKATLAMLQKVMEDQRSGYCVLLSGQDYPLRSNRFIREYFQKNEGANFIELFKVPTSRWAGEGLVRINAYKINLSNKREDFILLPSIFDTKFYTLRTFSHICKAVKGRKLSVFFRLLNRRRFPSYVYPYGGEHWWALPTKTVQETLLFLEEHPDYLKYHEDTLCVDEIFFQTIVGNLIQKNKIVVKPKVMYVNWKRKSVSLPVTFTKEDFEELKNAKEHFLFARKFDEVLDAQILDRIDQELLNLVKVSK